MRKALNENPRVQLAVLGIGALLLVIMLMTSMGSGGGAEPEPVTDPAATSSSTASGAAPVTDSASTADPAATAPATDPAASATPAPVTPAPAGTAEAVPATPSAGSGAGSAEGMLPGEGLPKDVLIAYARNKAIALLVIDPKGISDRRVKKFTKALRARGDVEVFVVKAGKIANYARITQGVSVTRTPSLVVIRPRNKSDDVPTATVSEGFRSAKSVRTALEDALYTGGERPSYPG